FHSYAAHRDLHSFPTRRSSDLSSVTLRSSPADPTVFRTGAKSGCSTLPCNFTFSPPISHAATVFTNPAVRKEFVEHITPATTRIRVEDQKHTAFTTLGHHRQCPASFFAHDHRPLSVGSLSTAMICKIYRSVKRYLARIVPSGGMGV